MKMKLLLLVILLGPVYTLYAQQIHFGNFEVTVKFMKREYQDYEELKEVVGSPFLDKNYSWGVFYLEDKKPVQAHLRYNVEEEEIQVKFEKDIYALPPEMPVEIEGNRYEKYDYRQKSDSQLYSGYFKILNDPKNIGLQLLEKPGKEFKNAQPPAAMKTPTLARYTDTSEFYLKFPKTDVPVFFETKAKNFIAVFPEEQQEKMVEFIKKNNLNLKNQEDLLRVVTFYNSSILENG